MYQKLKKNKTTMHFLFNIVVVIGITVPVFAFGNNNKTKTLEQELWKQAYTFLNKPYKAATLEKGETETLVANTDTVDCTTFVEYALAYARCEGKDKALYFEKSLKEIRYRNGIINGYSSRLHYSSDWIENGIQNHFMKDITQLYSTDTLRLHINFMSTHANLYPKLKNSPTEIEHIKEQENKLSGKIIHYIPKQKLPLEGFTYIHQGDIILLTTNIKGLDISHMGIACYKEGKLHLLHASSKHKLVLVEPIPLTTMLLRNKQCTGIRVIRPVKF